MTLAQNLDSAPDAFPAPSRRPSSGRDRRVHHRREVARVWAQIDGGWYPVHDLSLGGLSVDRPVEAPDVGNAVEGEIHSRAGGRQHRSTFQATVVRIDDDGSRIGAAFLPMEPEQIDGLLSILASVEREFVEAREAELRHEAFRRRLRRLGIAAAVAIVAVAAGYAAWMMT